MPYNQEKLRKADINIAAQGDNIIIAAPASPAYLAIDFASFMPTTAVGLQFKSGANNLGGPLPLSAQQAVTWENAIHNPDGVLTTNPGEAFIMNLDGNVQVGGIVRYRIVHES